MLEKNQIRKDLLKIISNKYVVAEKKISFLERIKHPKKFTYYEAIVSKFPKYTEKEATYGLKFGATKTSWIIISFCLLISLKIFYDFKNDSDWEITGVLIALGFLLSVIMFFGYKILSEYPIIEIKKDKLIYQRKQEILWVNIVLVGIIINRTGKLPNEKRILIGTKQKQIIELKVSLMDTNIQNIVDVILKNVS